MYDPSLTHNIDKAPLSENMAHAGLLDTRVLILLTCAIWGNVVRWRYRRTEDPGTGDTRSLRKSGGRLFI